MLLVKGMLFIKNVSLVDFYLNNYFQTGPLKCDVCDMTMNSQSTYDVHLTGRIHTRNLAIKKGDFPDAKL